MRVDSAEVRAYVYAGLYSHSSGVATSQPLFSYSLIVFQVSMSEETKRAYLTRNATVCIIWLHDPSMISWELTLSAIRWCSIDWLRKSTAPEICNVDEILPNLFEKAKNPVDLALFSDPSRT